VITTMSDGSSKEQAQKYIQTLLLWMTKNDASDLFILAGFPPAVKIHGELIPIPDAPRIMPEQTHLLTTSVMNSVQYAEFENTKECNFAISLSGVGRFRVNALQQRASAGMVIRVIRTSIPKLHDLGVPALLGELSMTKRGLLIMVGATGSGKSTTLAAMIDHRNENSKGHIITIEDPIEFTHNHKKCIITQREVGVDTDSWGAALKNTLRQAPDVIFMGEIRDRETMEYALQFAETGHLCMATLHANNANQAIDRVINFFPEERRSQTLMDLGMNLRAMVSQRLIPKKGGGRVPAIEILINTPLVSDKILKGETSDLKEVMKKSRESGMITFDESLYHLYKSGQISFEDGYRNADSANEYRLKVKLDSAGAGEDAQNTATADTPQEEVKFKII
jgi:twitching motility protein PilU